MSHATTVNGTAGTRGPANPGDHAEQLQALFDGSPTCDGQHGHRSLGPGGAVEFPFQGLLHVAPVDDAETILQRADEALYEAKAGGRDRVIVTGRQTDDLSADHRVK